MWWGWYKRDGFDEMPEHGMGEVVWRSAEAGIWRSIEEEGRRKGGGSKEIKQQRRGGLHCTSTTDTC
eukprot:747230-Hanusia_phi.AAC.2